MGLAVVSRRAAGRSRLLALCALSLLFGCETNQDPRSGGFVDGVVNLSTGGYEDYTEERRAEQEAAEEEARLLEARAATIEAERQEFDRELESAAQELGALQNSLSRLKVKLAATNEAKAAEQARLTEAEAQAKQAAKRLAQLRKEPDYSVVTRQTEVKELKGLISGVALMVEELSE